MESEDLYKYSMFHGLADSIGVWMNELEKLERSRVIAIDPVLKKYCVELKEVYERAREAAAYNCC